MEAVTEGSIRRSSGKQVAAGRRDPDRRGAHHLPRCQSRAGAGPPGPVKTGVWSWTIWLIPLVNRAWEDLFYDRPVRLIVHAGNQRR